MKNLITFKTKLKVGDLVLHKWGCLTHHDNSLVWSKVDSISVYYSGNSAHITIDVVSYNQKYKMSCTLHERDIKDFKKQ